MVFALLLLRNTLCHCSCFFVSVLLKHICYHCFGHCFVAIEWYIVLFYWSLFLCFWKMHCIILSLFCSLFLSCWRIHCIIHSLFDSLFHCCWKVHCSGHYFSVLVIISVLLKNTLYHCSVHCFRAIEAYIVSLFCSLFQGYWSIHCVIVLFTVSVLLKDTLSVSWCLQTVFHLGRCRWKRRRHGMLSSQQKPTTFPQVGFAMLGRCSVYLQTYKQLFSPMVVDWTSKHVSCTWAKSCQVAIIKCLCKDWKRFKKKKKGLQLSRQNEIWVMIPSVLQGSQLMCQCWSVNLYWNHSLSQSVNQSMADLSATDFWVDTTKCIMRYDSAIFNEGR